jgi:phosphoglycerol transferase MdoB-like AlkP superfamily enzyme
MLFFVLMRLIFLVYNAGQLKGIEFIPVLAVFWHALHLDISTACYIMAFPFLVMVIQSIWSPRWLNTLHIIYSAIILLLLSAITIAEAGVYEEWRTKLHFKALLYLRHPAEIVNTAGTGLAITGGVIFLILSAGSFIIWHKWFFVKIIHLKRNLLFSFLFLIITAALMAFGIRGGLKQVPINQSDAYFSKHEILNLAAVNSGWNLVGSVIQNYKAMGSNPFVYYTSKEAKEKVAQLYTVPCDSTQMILKTGRPNIVMFILEGWSADLIEALGGDKQIMPHFNSMVKDGMLFTDFYSSGTRSQQGMAAIYSGFPAEPYSTITQQPEKYNKLPSMVKALKKVGYQTSFYFGGELDYGNMKSYMMFNDFDRITEGADFDASLPRGKLGIHDEYTFKVMESDLDKEKQPFFASIFTVSTHSPYDYDKPAVLSGYEIESQYVNAANYADQCVYDFITNARKKPWFSNTLFIFISDHGHSTYKNRDIYSPDYHKLVFMLYGDVLREECKGSKANKTGSQTDLPATLLPQLGISAREFKWSKDLLNPCVPGFAYFSFEVGLGWVRPCGCYVNETRYSEPKYLQSLPGCIFSTDSLRKEGNSYLQELYREYLDM